MSEVISSTTYVSRKITTSGTFYVSDLMNQVDASFDKLVSSNNVSFEQYNKEVINEYVSSKNEIIYEITLLKEKLKGIVDIEVEKQVNSQISFLNDRLEELMSSNTVGAVATEKYNKVNVSQYLRDCNSQHKPVCQGLTLAIEELVPGNIDNNQFILLNPTKVNRKSSHSKSSKKDSLKSDFSGTSLSVAPLAWFWRIVNNKYNKSVPLPVAPEEVTDSNSAEFNSETMMGRSVSYQLYESSSREISFTLQLRADLIATTEGVTPEEHIYRIVSLIESCCYPNYNESEATTPPEVAFQIIGQFFIRGVLKSCSASWSPPIINGKYVNCNLSLSVQETTGPYSTYDIIDEDYNGTRSFRTSGMSYESY